METINWGIAAPGRIAASFAKALSSVPGCERIAVASRDSSRAKLFAEKWGFRKSYGSYEELFNDPEVDIVYIASPHMNHAALSIAAMEAGKSVICEKPAAVSAEEFRKVIDCAHRTGRFFMEAMWMLFNPAILETVRMLKSGTIGNLRHITANFCSAVKPNPEDRLFNPFLAGGALLDAGIYPVTFAMKIAAAASTSDKNLAIPAVLQSTARMGNIGYPQSNGVDYWNFESLLFTEGRQYTDGKPAAAGNAISAVLSSSIDSAFGPYPEDAYLTGTEGSLYLKQFWTAQTITVFDNNGKELRTVSKPFRVNGYEYEVEAVCDCLRSGQTECGIHPIADTLSVLSVLDAARKQWNLVYPFERNTSGNTNLKTEGEDQTTSDIVIYTDGGCSGNPGPGGWGTVILVDGKETKLSGGERSTTNNRMELTAAISALSTVAKISDWKGRNIYIYSDSQYVKNGIASWIKGWKAKGWMTAGKQPVKNQDLWKQLDSLVTSLSVLGSVSWKWVKGHAGIKYNEECDAMCGEEIQKFSKN